MHGRRILYSSIAAWIVLATYEVVNTTERGPDLPTPLHNLLLSALITLTIIGTILMVHSRPESQPPRPGLPPQRQLDDHQPKPTPVSSGPEYPWQVYADAINDLGAVDSVDNER